MSVVKISLSVSQYWTDIYLSWNPENYPGVQNLRFPSDQIWTPDILLYNRSELLSPPHHHRHQAAITDILH